MAKKILSKYVLGLKHHKVNVVIEKNPEEFVPRYKLNIPELEPATLAFLEDVRDKLIEKIPIKLEDIRDPDSFKDLKRTITKQAREIIKEGLPDSSKEAVEFSSIFVTNEMVGLGNIEFLLEDENLEEIVINTSKEPIWVYHKEFGWLKTNVFIDDEEQIKNYSSIIGRRVGRQINVLDPLMDAHLWTGDRVNSTLFPVSSKGNTITIRKFRKKPWTITDFINNNTLDKKTAAFIWLCMQYELSVIVAGGTATGKTSLLNCILAFAPPDQRIISIEETRELNLPKFLHWLPMIIREPNPEGKGEVTMLDLLVNSLRMRPDRIVVGEVRRQPEAEVLFEALNTGHSVYSTLHANTAEEAFRRLTSPPINLPEDIIRSLPLFAIMFRQRRKNVRRLFELTEIIPEEKIKLKNLFAWNAKKDKVEEQESSERILKDMERFTGLTKEEIKKDISEKEKILDWMVKLNINTINTVGKVMSEYYSDKEKLLKDIKAKKGEEIILGKYISELEG